MKENHFAYKITHKTNSVDCNYPVIERAKMLDLLKDIQQDESECIYWVFKQFEDSPQEQLCIIDKVHNKIYYTHSSEVEELAETIERLSQ